MHEKMPDFSTLSGIFSTSFLPRNILRFSKKEDYILTHFS